jgi:hypothetical protein
MTTTVVKLILFRELGVDIPGLQGDLEYKPWLARWGVPCSGSNHPALGPNSCPGSHRS